MRCSQIYFSIVFSILVCSCESVDFNSFKACATIRRKLLSSNGLSTFNHTHETTSGTKTTSTPFKENEHMAGAEAVVLIIVVIVVLSVIAMVIYFMRKFDQLNRSLPAYRYSSLKTEVNGLYGDDKIDSQVLVSVSTEEEDYDEEEEQYVSPPTLLVSSQTVTPKSENGTIHIDNDSESPRTVKIEVSVDSDDELLQ